MSISVEAARAFAHDNESSAEEIKDYIAAAEAYIKDGIGADVDLTDSRVVLLTKMLVCEFDNTRCFSGSKEANAVSWAARAMMFQLRVALKKEATASG